MAKEDFYPVCKFNKEGLLECTPKSLSDDGMITTRSPMKFHVDRGGRITLVDSGDAPEWLIDKTIKHIEKNLIVKK